MSSFYQTIVSLLPKLSDDERNALSQRLAALRSLGSSSPKASNTADCYQVLSVICSFLSARGLEHASIIPLMQSQQYSAFAAKVPLVLKFFKIENRAMRERLLYISIELLYKDLTEMGFVVSSRTLMSQIHRLPATINRHFPHYAENNLLGMLLKKG